MKQERVASRDLRSRAQGRSRWRAVACLRGLLAATVAALLAASPLAAQQFTLASLNCLHLGWGPEQYQGDKQNILKELFAGFDVVILQEVMAQANLSFVTPGFFAFQVTPVLGPGSYKEAYGFIYKTGFSSGLPITTPVAGFSRPPSGILLGANGQWTWIVDYHAVYGRSISVRRSRRSH